MIHRPQRILFLSNFYPPQSRGGYEQWCGEVAEDLVRRGHHILVLTSTHRRENRPEADPAWVRRELFLEMEFSSLNNALLFFTSRKQREAADLALLERIIGDFAPDAILIWGMWNLPRSLPALAEKLMPGRVVYYVGDFWPTQPGQFKHYWEAPARNGFTGLLKSVLKPVALGILDREVKTSLELRCMIFPSEFMRSEFGRLGITAGRTSVVYGAVNTTPYLNEPDCRDGKDFLSLLFVGRLEHEKGAHTAIQALGHLTREPGIPKLKLTILGSGEPAYEAHLHALAARENVASLVTFLPAQPSEALPSIYHQADIFLFTSIWPEPFGRVIVEAMASGLPVVGAAVGGAAEMLIEEETALTFRPDDPQDLSRQIRRLVESPSLRERLGRAGRKAAADKFDIQRMAAGIEACLAEIGA